MRAESFETHLRDDLLTVVFVPARPIKTTYVEIDRSQARDLAAVLMGDLGEHVIARMIQEVDVGDT